MSKLQLLGDRFQIGGVVGEGDFAVVHFALDTITGDTVAVKVFHRTRRNFSQKRIDNEISALQRLTDSQFCVNYLAHFDSLDNATTSSDETKKLSHEANECGGDDVDDDELSDCAFIVTNFIKGIDLQEKMSKMGCPFEIDVALKYFSQVVSAVIECHAASVFHRDLKPSNMVLIEKTGMVKLVDFGCAIVSEDGFVSAQSRGSPAITPPEIASGICSSVRGAPVDVWGLGITLYILLHNRPPFQGNTEFDLYNKIATEGHVLKLPEGRNTVDLARLLDAMLHKDPELRISLKDVKTAVDFML